MAKTKTITLEVKDIQTMIERGEIPATVYKKLERALAKQRITTASAKAKGRKLQQLICSEIADSTGIPYTQSDDDCLIHSREMGQHGVDIILRGLARKLYPFSIECKATEKLSLGDALKQAQTNVTGGTRPLVVFNNRSTPEPIVALLWSDFRQFIESTWSNE